MIGRPREEGGKDVSSVCGTGVHTKGGWSGTLGHLRDHLWNQVPRLVLTLLRCLCASAGERAERRRRRKGNGGRDDDARLEGRAQLEAGRHAQSRIDKRASATAPSA